MINEEDFIDLTCPYCGDPVSFPVQNRGSLQQCPSCADTIIVPEDAGQPARAVAVPFQTARLTMRRLEPGDWKDLLELVSDEETFRYMPGHPLDEETVLRWLESDPHVKLTTPDQTFCLGLGLREREKLIGFTGLQLSAPELRQASFTVQLNRAFQKQGLATEAVGGLLRFCFDDLKLRRVSASCDLRNAAALKLLQNAGFRREGEFVKDSLIHGQWTNTVWFAVLREEHKPTRSQTPA